MRTRQSTTSRTHRCSQISNPGSDGPRRGQCSKEQGTHKEHPKTDMDEQLRSAGPESKQEYNINKEGHASRSYPITLANNPHRTKIVQSYNSQKEELIEPVAWQNTTSSNRLVQPDRDPRLRRTKNSNWRQASHGRSREKHEYKSDIILATRLLSLCI